MALNRDAFKAALKQKGKTTPNPNLEIDKEKMKAKEQAKIKSIRFEDYEALRRYAFFNDMKVIDAISIALERLQTTDNIDQLFEQYKSDYTDKEYHSVRITPESMKILQKISFETRQTMLDIVSVAVRLLNEAGSK